MDSSQSIYQKALAAQLGGRSEDAVTAYRNVLAIEPGHPEANHNLGLLAFQAGDIDEALERLMNAVEARPGEKQFWLSLVEVLVGIQALDHAAQAIEQARVAGLPQEQVDALALRLRQAVDDLNAAASDDLLKVAINDDEPRIQAAVERILQRSNEVRASGKRAVLRGRPLDKKLVEKMTTMFNAGELHEVDLLAGKAIKSHPLHPGGWHFLGMAKLRLGEGGESIKALIKANELFPGDAQMLDHLGSALASFNHIDLAVKLYDLSLRIRPNHIDTVVRYANLEINQRNFEHAEELARAALLQAPNGAATNRVMAAVMLSTRRVNEAVSYLHRAIEADQHMADAYQDLGYAYFNLGNLQGAIETSTLAIERNPENVQAYSNLLFFMAHDHELDPKQVFERHLEFSDQFEKPLLQGIRPHENDRDPERRLRVGIVSADLYDHAVAHFIAPVLQGLDRESFDVFAFHNTTKFDAVSEALKSFCKYWVSVSHVSDRDLAELVRACRIDILIDLSGHTGGHRLLTFARKPAPVQVTWIGYPYTTGLQNMDYILTGSKNFDDSLYTEKIVRLPVSSSFQFPEGGPEVNPLPALRNGFLTFGSFNRIGKVSRGTLDLWARAMHACPASRFLVGSVLAVEVADRLKNEFVMRGIGAERLEFEGRKPTHEYLAMHHRVDVVLDTFPYNGSTTSRLALWMGVPVLTMRGKARVGRAGAGNMEWVQLEDFIAEDEDEFVAIAADLAADFSYLSEVRAGLRRRLVDAPSRDGSAVARGVGKALRKMWQGWCKGEEATSFAVIED